MDYILLHCNIVENDCLQNYKLLYELVPDKMLGQLIFVKPPVFIQCKTSDTIFDYIEIWFTDQNNNYLQIEDIRLILIYKLKTKYLSLRTDNKIRKYVKGYGFMSFSKSLGSKYSKKNYG